jgi:hypothetical protein
MGPAWPVLIFFIAVLAAVPSRPQISHASPLRTNVRDGVVPSSVPHGAPFLKAEVTGDLAERARQWLAALKDWIVASYSRAPALVLGLAALLVVPPLALIGLMLRGQRAAPDSPDSTYIQTRKRTRTPRRHADASQDEEPLWPSKAWLEMDAQGTPRYDIGRSVVRIGREDDNDICINDMTVHRYHAAIHRTEDAEFVITDLSSSGGNGVVVNGRRVSEARLNDGDIIELGLARFKFAATPA